MVMSDDVIYRRLKGCRGLDSRGEERRERERNLIDII
jgi:hypothetical protein